MSLIDALRHRLRALLHSETHARDLDDELHFHLSLARMQREHTGRDTLTAADAEYAARRHFGNVTYVKEEVRQMSGLGFVDMARQDARFALRTFRRAPGFTMVVVLTLAIGIGANTAIFSAVNALLFRPLPFTDPSRLMKVSLTAPSTAAFAGSSDFQWSYPKFAIFRDGQHVFSDLTLYMRSQITVSGNGEPERDDEEIVSRSYLTTLGIQAAIGRNFLEEEDRHPDGPRVVLLSNALWSRRFNADPNALGKTLDVAGNPYTVVGVLPPGFRGLSGTADLWIPVMSLSALDVNEPWNHTYTLVARLNAGVSPEQAVAVARQLGRRVDAAYPANPGTSVNGERWGATATLLDAGRVDPLVRRSLLILLAAVGLVLLIGCANVANLFLVRATGRRREIAVRLAVGASRWRLIRQLLTESLLLSLLGGAVSIAVAWWGVRLLSALNPASALHAQHLSGLGVVDFTSIHLDPAAFAFAMVLALATGLLFGLVPALQATRPSLTGALKEEIGTMRAHGRRGISARSVLAVVEITLSVVLLAGSGLMLRSLANLLQIDPGFDAEHLLTLRLNTPVAFTGDSLPGFYDRMLDRLGSLPGAASASLTDCPPLNGGCNGTIIRFHDRAPVTPGSEPLVGVHWVTAGWFGDLKVPLLRGRLFTRADRVGTPKVIVINEAAARAFWPGQDPIGRPVGVFQGGMDSATVIGVVGDVRFDAISSAAKPDAYISYYQSPRGRMMLFVGTTGDPRVLAAPAREALHELAPNLPIYDIRSMESRVADSISYARFSTLLLALFGVMALALATMGTYGVISFGVAQRTREIGIRVALGATRADVTRLVVGQGIGLAVAGGAIGLAAAVLTTRVLRSLLYDVAPSDPVTFVAIMGLLALAVVAASWFPARRAARIDPTEALREG